MMALLTGYMFRLTTIHPALPARPVRLLFTLTGEVVLIRLEMAMDVSMGVTA